MEYTNLTSENNNDVVLDLLLAVVEYETEGIQGMQKEGLCSNFLANAELESDVFMFIKRSEFHLPETKNPFTERKLSVLETLGKITSIKGLEPVLLIGAGSGLAPFRGFYQQMMLNSIEKQHHQEIVQKIENLNYEDSSEVDVVKKLIETYVERCKEGMCSKRSIKLFFGCRNQENNLLSKETKLYETFLTRFDAFSNDESYPKEYNYQVMDKQSRIVYNALVKQSGFIYVCGKITMADDVFKCVASIIAKHLVQDNGIADDKERISFVEQIAEDFLNSLRDNGRYDQDIFGN